MCRPPLCAAVGSQKPLELVNLLILPCKTYRSGLGVGELEKKASALAYAMLSGQHDIVNAVSTKALLLFASSTQRSTVQNVFECFCVVLQLSTCVCMLASSLCSDLTQ
jgi:hypothetical protein